MFWSGMFDMSTTQGIWFRIIIGIVLPLAALFALYWFTFRKYRRYLMYEYGYKINGVPAALGVASFLLIFMFGGKDNSLGTFADLIGIPDWIADMTVGFNWETVKIVFILSTPWVIIGTIIGLIKTKKLLLTAVNILVLYAYIIIGGLAIVYLGWVMLLAFMGLSLLSAGKPSKSMLGDLMGGAQTSMGNCPFCGKPTANGETCPSCRGA